MKLICFLFGHKPADHTDSGYQICQRCNMHEYYHGKYYSHETGQKWPYYHDDAQLLRPYYWAKRVLWRVKSWHLMRTAKFTCEHCHATTSALKWRGDECPECGHQNLPF